MKRLIIVNLWVVCLINISFVFGEELYSIDPSHADIGFSVSHLVINKVRGKFTDFDGFLVVDDRGKIIDAEAVMKIESIDTGIAGRDDHLRSADFFDAETFPEMTFKQLRFRKRLGKDALIGKLTIKDITRTVILWCNVKGPIIDPWGTKRIGLHAKTSINRLDYGLNWNKTLEAGGVLVGEEVEIVINIEGTLYEE